MSLKIPGPAPNVQHVEHRSVTAIAYEEGRDPLVIPLATEHNFRQQEGTVPLRLELQWKLAEAGKYSTLGIRVSNTAYHPDGDMVAKDCVFDRELLWAVTAIDRNLGLINQLRRSLGHTGDWSPT